MNKRFIFSLHPGRYLLIFCLALSMRAAPTNVIVPARPAPVVAASTNAVSTNAVPATAFDPGVYERDRILNKAMAALTDEPVTITKSHGPYSEGGSNDFYSMGDSWFPDPTSPNGLPYKQHPGEVNPDNFNDHKKCLWQMRENVAALAAAYKITGNNRYATVAAEWLRVFFIDPATRMNPNLTYAQSVPGVTKGRTMGVSDVLALVEIPKAVEALQNSPGFPPAVLAGMKQWGSNYLAWLAANIGEEAATLSNSHNLIYWLQTATWAGLVGDEDRVADCRAQFKLFSLPGQINADGSFNKAGKYRSYSTAVGQLDELATLCQDLSTPGENLWNFKSANSRDVHMAVEYMYPFIADKTKWPKIETTELGWPGRRVSLLFAGLAYGDSKYIDLWKRLPADPTQEDVRRFLVVTQPVLWIK